MVGDGLVIASKKSKKEKKRLNRQNLNPFASQGAYDFFFGIESRDDLCRPLEIKLVISLKSCFCFPS